MQGRSYNVILRIVKKIIIAIDGYSACGKSSTARRVARELGYTYIDTGAMYRAASLYFLRHNIRYDFDNPHVADALKNIRISFTNDASGRVVTWLNEEPVESMIRSIDVSRIVSEVSALRDVRVAMVREQQRMGRERGVVMDGRDIGTVVFPNAELKIFMTADLDVRLRRRQKELEDGGMFLSVEEIRKNLLHRDFKDSNRKESPLIQAPDALLLDTSDLTFEQQVTFIVERAMAIITQPA